MSIGEKLDDFTFWCSYQKGFQFNISEVDSRFVLELEWFDDVVIKKSEGYIEFQLLSFEVTANSLIRKLILNSGIMIGMYINHKISVTHKNKKSKLTDFLTGKMRYRLDYKLTLKFPLHMKLEFIWDKYLTRYRDKLIHEEFNSGE